MRALALILAIFCVLIPQVVCFLPGEEMTQAEMECCEHMAADCGGANMQGHECCKGVVKPDAAVVTAALRDSMPSSDLATPYISEATDFAALISEAATLARRDFHPPPRDPDASLLALHI